MDTSEVLKIYMNSATGFIAQLVVHLFIVTTN